MDCPTWEAHEKCLDSQGADGYPVLAVCEENLCTPSSEHTYREWCLQPPGWNPDNDDGNTNCDSSTDTTDSDTPEEPVSDPFASCLDNFKFKMRTGKAKVTRAGSIFIQKFCLKNCP